MPDVGEGRGLLELRVQQEIAMHIHVSQIYSRVKAKKFLHMCG